MVAEVAGCVAGVKAAAEVVPPEELVGVFKALVCATGVGWRAVGVRSPQAATSKLKSVKNVRNIKQQAFFEICRMTSSPICERVTGEHRFYLICDREII